MIPVIEYVLLAAIFITAFAALYVGLSKNLSSNPNETTFLGILMCFLGVVFLIAMFKGRL